MTDWMSGEHVDPVDPSWAARRLSFGAVADMYDRARASYAVAAVDWVLPDGARRVLDLAAGTGKLTQVLVGHDLDIVAIDPSEPMLELLRRKLPDVDARAGSAEATGLPDADVDAVVIGSALHWFDRPSADSEVARVLRPGGIVGVFGNRRDHSVPWVADLDALIAGRTELKQQNKRETRAATFDAELFGPVEVAEFPFRQELDADGLADLFSSRSYVIGLNDADRARLLDEIRDFARTHADLAGRSTFELPYLTIARRQIRRP
jgi:SAM-dependent methyltransferase